MEDEALAEVVSGIRKRPYGGYTELYRWLRAHHATLAHELATHAPAWQTVAEKITSIGITGRFGAKLSAGGVRRVWLTVCNDLEAERAAAELERLTGVRPTSRRNKAAARWLPSGFAQPAQSNAPSLTRDVHQGNHSAALSTVPQQRPALPPTSGATGSSSRHAPGSIAAAREKANLRSGLKSNGDPKY